jgi:uncharacterized protein (TIRG00374 family)
MRSLRLPRWARPVVAVAVTVGFFVLFARQAELGHAAAAIAELPAGALAGALAAVLLNLALVVLRWSFLLRAAGFRVPFTRLFGAVSSGTAANNVLPARAGDLLRVEAVRGHAGTPLFVLAGTLFAERLLDGVVLSVWILAGALLLGTGGPLLLTGIALSAGSTLGVVLVALAAARPAAAERAARRLPDRAGRAAVSFVHGLAAFRSGGLLLLALGLSSAVWLADLALYAVLGAGLGLDAGLGGYLALEGIGNLALAVPATAAGLGSFDYLTLVTAEGLEVPAGPATGYVLLVHAFVVLPVTVIGLLLLPRALATLGRRPLPEPA